MTNKETVEYILNKFPETKYNRCDFFLKYIEQFLNGGKPLFFITKEQFRNFWIGFAGIERTLREILKDPKYAPKPEQDQKRYKKAKNFQIDFKKN